MSSGMYCVMTLIGLYVPLKKGMRPHQRTSACVSVFLSVFCFFSRLSSRLFNVVFTVRHSQPIKKNKSLCIVFYYAGMTPVLSTSWT